jgi:hypothetical protein
MHTDGSTEHLIQLPLDIVIERKDNLLQSLEAIFEKLDSLASDINFLWDHQALCKHQVKVFVPLPARITKRIHLNNCPNCFWCKLEGQLQLSKEVRTRIENGRIRQGRTALFTRGPIRARRKKDINTEEKKALCH